MRRHGGGREARGPASRQARRISGRRGANQLLAFGFGLGERHDGRLPAKSHGGVVGIGPQGIGLVDDVGGADDGAGAAGEGHWPTPQQEFRLRALIPAATSVSFQTK